MMELIKFNLNGNPVEMTVDSARALICILRIEC